jgi:hypothetical protein
VTEGKNQEKKLAFQIMKVQPQLQPACQNAINESGRQTRPTNSGRGAAQVAVFRQAKRRESSLNTTAEKAEVILVPALRALPYPQRLMLEFPWGGRDSKFARGSRRSVEAVRRFPKN